MTPSHAHLQNAGVVLLPGSMSAGKTATATARIAADGSADYTFDIDWALAPLALPYAPRILHTGSIATFLEPGASVVRSLLEQAQGGCMVTYDPNIRADLLGSHHEALALFEEIVPLTDVVKLSGTDARWLYPGKALEDTANHLLALGTGLGCGDPRGQGLAHGHHGTYSSTSRPSRPLWQTPSALAIPTRQRSSWGCSCVAATDWRPPCMERIGTIASMAASIAVGRPGANPPTHRELLVGMAR